MTSQPDAGGHFGPYGGRYAPEVLMSPLEELEQHLRRSAEGPGLPRRTRRAAHHLRRPPHAALFRAPPLRSTRRAKIYIKREDLLHTGAHKINNCLGQALLARRMGKRRIIAETGAGQHGVATATVCALFGFDCTVYMGEEDMRRQRLNVFRMRLLGANVVGVTNGSRTLKDAISEAMRDWVTNVATTHYLLGSALGAHPYPDHGARFPSRHRRRSAAADSRSRRPPARCRVRLRRRRQQRHRHLPSVHRRRRREAHRRGSRRTRPDSWASMPRGLPADPPAFCRARAATFCRTTRPDLRSRIPFRPASITPRSDPSTPGCTTAAAPNTAPAAITTPSTPPSRSAAPKASFPRSNPRTRWPRRSAARRLARARSSS